MLEVSPEILVVGAITGLTYAALAAGLVLIYRSSGIINFSHAQLGAFGAAVLGKLTLDGYLPWPAAFVVALTVGAAIGAGIDRFVMRRLVSAPRLMPIVATVALSQLLMVAEALIPKVHRPAPFPTGLHRTASIGHLVLGGQHFLAIALIPAAMAALSMFLLKTPFGVAIRAGAGNRDAARLAGIRVDRATTAVWAIAGVLAVMTAVIVAPLRGVFVGQPATALGAGLLMRALAAGLVGRMESLSLAVAGGVGIGIVEAVVFVNVSDPGVADGLIFALVVGLLLLRAPRTTGQGGASWILSQAAAVGRATPRALRGYRLTWVALAAGAVLAPMVWSHSSSVFLQSRILVYLMIGLSVTVVVGYAGQLSLGQFAFVGVGSMTTAALVARHMPFWASVAYSVVASVLVALILGLPSLRIRGLALAVATLAFAVGAREFLFTRHFLTDGRATQVIPRQHLGPLDLTSQRTYYYLCLSLCAASLLVVGHLRRTGIARRWIGVRDNELAAAAYGVSPAASKLTAFLFSAALAGLGGALLGGLRVQFSASAFGAEESLRVLSMTVIGGVGSVAGAVVGTGYVIGLPALFGDRLMVQLLVSGAGLLALVMYMPSGLIGSLARIVSRFDAPTVPQAAPAGSTAQPKSQVSHLAPRAANPSNVDLVQMQNIRVEFGGLVAVADVSLVAVEGETVGLIGSNGAGKSTLLNVLGGFQPHVGGRVLLRGEDITTLKPAARAAQGIGRLFQDARLFPGLTVLECVQLALEQGERSQFLPSALALGSSRRAERRKQEEALSIVSELGLQRFAATPAALLSTGTRRIVEIACLTALKPSLLLLDEPTAGIAQREIEAFVPLILAMKARLGATVIIVEHDMPLMMELCDRIYCLGSGLVIAEGTAQEIRADARVVAAYLGTDDRVIERSGIRAS